MRREDDTVSLPVIYAKKMRLPSARANIAQSLNMALALGLAGGEVRCFPGAADAAVVRQSLDGLGVSNVPSGWTVLPGGKGVYGLRFRLAVASAALALPGAALFARDLPEAQFLRFLTKLLKRPLFFEAHEILHLMHQGEGKARWQDTLRRERAVFTALSGLVCTTEAVAAQAREALGYGGPLLIAPNGYNPALFHPLPLFTQEAPWPEASAPFTMVYVGNFHPGKGVEELVEALALLPERFRLRIVGGEPQDAFAALRARAEALHIHSRIEFIGAVPQKAVRAACAGAHVFVIPQQSAFFFSPLKLYEAMALGLPVLCTPLPVFSHCITGGTALAAPGTEPAALAQAVSDLAGHPRLAQSLREKGLAEAAAHTWERRARAVLEFMSSILCQYRVPLNVSPV